MDNAGSQNHSNHRPLLDDLLYRCYRNSGRLLPLCCPFPVSCESTLVQAQHFLSVFCLSTTLQNLARTSHIFTNSEIGPRTFALWFVLLISLPSIPRRQIENIAECLTSRSQTICLPTVWLNRFRICFTSLSKKLTALESPPVCWNKKGAKPY